MTEEEQKFAFAVAAVMGLVARGATPAEVRDTAWQYAEFAFNGRPQENQE
jgi:predicted RNase H-like HicB family nuclease